MPLSTHRRWLLLPALALSSVLSAQIAIDNTLSPTYLVQNVLLGQGVVVSNITFNSQPGGIPNEQIGSFGGVCNIGLSSGVILGTGDVHNAEGPNDSGSSSLGGGNWNAFDQDLFELAGGDQNDSIRDKACLEFDFIPTGDSLKFDFVFASDEYLEFVNSINDAFGFFLSGPGISGPYTNGAVNIALVPNTSMPVTIDNVNDVVNSAYYVDNGDGTTSPEDTDPRFVQYDGFTVVMTARAAVTCGLTYHIKIIVGDASDTSWDSAVFLQAGSFTTTGSVIPELSSGVGVNDSTFFEGCGLLTLDFRRLGDTTNTDTVEMVVTGTATAGVDYSPPLPTQLIYQPGDTLISFPMNVPLDADGLETIHIHITQNVICSGQQVENDYDFYIDQPPPLTVVTNDIAGTCGQAYDLVPQVSGGTGYRRFQWDNGATTPTIHVQPSVTTTYHFTVSDTCSVLPVTDSITVTLPVFPPLAIVLSPDTAIPCLGNADIAVVNTTGGNGTYTYAWSHNGAPLGNTTTINVPAAEPPTYYAITVTEGCGAQVTDSVQVSTAVLPPIEIFANDTTVLCPTDTVVLRPPVTGGNGVYTYAWRDAANTVLSTADTLQVAVPTDAEYHLLVQDQCGYSADSTVATLLPHYDPFTLVLTADTTICEFDSVQVWAQVTGGSGHYTLQWPGQDWTDPQYTVSPYENTTYTVNVIDECGAVLSDEVEVKVEHPRAQILIRNEGQDDWLFQAQTNPFVCAVYRWDLGDGTTSRDDQVAHSYMDLDDHWVRLHVVSYTGCVANDSLLVRPPGHIYFPNCFTPDGDGINETFGPIGHNIEEFEMSVYDRWGHLVYTTEDWNKPWDGKVNGSDAAMQGVYIYKYRVKGHYFEADEAYGSVTLLRGSQDGQ